MGVPQCGSSLFRGYGSKNPTRTGMNWMELLFKYADKESVTKVFDAVHVQQWKFLNRTLMQNSSLPYLSDAFSITIASR